MGRCRILPLPRCIIWLEISRPPNYHTSPIDTNTTKNQHLADFNIESKITKHPVVVSYRSDQHEETPENTLMEQTFQPRTFTVHLEKGCFQHQSAQKTPMISHIHGNLVGFNWFLIIRCIHRLRRGRLPACCDSADSLVVWKWVRLGAKDLGLWKTLWLESCVIYVDLFVLQWVMGYAAHVGDLVYYYYIL